MAVRHFQFRVRERKIKDLYFRLRSTVHATWVAEGLFKDGPLELGYLVRVYLKNEVPLNVINGPSEKITQVFRKLERCFHQD